jgi:hypothetical protein
MASGAERAAPHASFTEEDGAVSAPFLFLIGKNLIVVPAKAGTHSHRRIDFTKAGAPSRITTNVGRNGSLLSQGRTPEEGFAIRTKIPNSFN